VVRGGFSFLKSPLNPPFTKGGKLRKIPPQSPLLTRGGAAEILPLQRVEAKDNLLILPFFEKGTTNNQ